MQHCKSFRSLCSPLHLAVDVLDQVHWRREANTETSKVTQAYQRLKLTMTTTFAKLAVFRAMTFTNDPLWVLGPKEYNESNSVFM